MNVNAKQLNSVDFHSMDVTTALGFFGQIQAQIAANTTLATARGNVWTTFIAARRDADQPQRGSHQHHQLEAHTTQREEGDGKHADRRCQRFAEGLHLLEGATARNILEWKEVCESLS